jgi:hypothetical protein
MVAIMVAFHFINAWLGSAALLRTLLKEAEFFLARALIYLPERSLCDLSE